MRVLFIIILAGAASLEAHSSGSVIFLIFVRRAAQLTFSIFRLPCAKKARQGTFDCVCNSSYCDTIQIPETLDPGVFYVYKSSASGDRFDLQRVNSGNHQTGYISVNVDTRKASQEILGFGGSLTDAAGINLELLSAPARAKLLDSYFSENGLEYSFVRLPIGGSDFSPRFYTNLDDEGHVLLRTEDYDFKIPYLREILARKSDVKLLGSSWLAPEWMTQEGFFWKETIKPEYYRQWAEYHKGFFDKYKEEGIEFWGATAGNEVVNGMFSISWPMKGYQEWINEHLGPVLEDSGYGNMKLLFLDDQTCHLPKWQDLLFDNTTNKYVDGAATHWYFEKDVYVFHEIFHAYFPDKLIINTEASICEYEKDFKEKTGWYGAEMYAENIIEKLNSHCNGWIDWNLALDSNGGPNYRNNMCTAGVIVNVEADEFYKAPIFYAMGHFSKFIPSGSRQIYSSTDPGDIDLKVAALKVEDSPWNVTVVLLNKDREEKNVEVCIDTEFCGIVRAPPRSIVSVIANTNFE